MSLRDIINYTGEGCKPILKREEIKKAINEVEEQRTVVVRWRAFKYTLLFNFV